MRIGIDISPLSIPYPCGIKNYARFLLNAIAKVDRSNKYILFSFKDVKVPKQANFELVVIASKLPFLKRQVLLPLVTRKYKLDVFHFLEPSGSIMMFPQNILTTIHDTSLSYTYPFFTKHIIRRIFAETLQFISYKTSANFIAISNNTMSEMVARKNIDPEKISQIYYGVNPGFYPDRKTLSKKHILSIGDFSPRKNLIQSLKAYAVLSPEIRQRYRLVIVVSTTGVKQNLFRLAHKLRIASNLIIYQNADKKLMHRLYCTAICFLYPSLYEGFGMPILEAMASSCPVITSNFGAMKEIAGDAAYLINPHSLNQIKGAVIEIVSNKGLQRKLARRGYKHAKQYDWKKTALQTIDVYKTFR